MKRTHSGARQARPFPTMREMLRDGRRGGKFRAPWFAGYPNRNQTVWSRTLKRK